MTSDPTELQIDHIIQAVERGTFDAALNLSETMQSTGQLEPGSAGRIAALNWFCRYSLDDNVEVDDLSEEIKDEIQFDYLHQMGIQFAELDANYLAVVVFERLATAVPDQAPSWHSFGLSLLNDNNHEAAIEALRRAGELDPNNPSVHYLMAHCFDAIGEPEQAASAYENCLSITPDDLDALILAGMAYSDIEEFDSAITKFERALALDAENPSVIFNLAVVFYRMSDENSLRVNIEKLARLAPQDARTSLAKALQCELTGAGEAPWPHFERAFVDAEAAEDWTLLEFVIARALSYAREHEEPDQAGAWLDRIFSHHCTDATALDCLRHFTGPEINQPLSFELIVEGRLMAESSVEGKQQEVQHEEVGYVSTLVVIAGSQQQATELAFEFEERCGRYPQVAELADSNRLPEPQRGGIVWCPDRINVYPVDDGEVG